MTTEIEKKRRELFEKLFPRGQLTLDPDGLYSGYMASWYNARWQGFNAALDAVEIELPDIHPLPDGDGLDDDPDIWEVQMDIANSANSMRGQCAKAITATGLGLRIK